MKKIAYIIMACMAIITSLVSCVDLDLNPLSAASSENWYSTTEEIRISLNDFYRAEFYVVEQGWSLDRNTDDWSQRTNIYPIAAGSIDASTAKSNINVAKTWSYSYKNVSRANRILSAIDRLEGKYSVDELNALRAEACFFRAFAYARLITLWGDVPFYLEAITPEEAFKMGRTDKKTVLEQIYKDYDYAAEYLPLTNNSSSVSRVEKGAAYAFKARIALYQKDYRTAVEAAAACIALDKYSLYPDYGELFRDKTKHCENIFSIVRSTDLEVGSDGEPTTQGIGSFIARSAGGTHNAQPSWELLAVYEMTNGKTIDDPDSGFDPHNPFLNRDPRCCETFAAPGTRIYNIEWNPAPDKLQTMDYSSGQMITNKDSKGGSDATNAAYNGCCLRKGAQDEWRERLYNDNPVMLMRYADVLLMYAEAKIELGEIDQTVLAYMNDVRARAYGVTRAETDSYPEVTVTDQTELRKILRRERRVEFAWENLRYYDLQRWGQFENAFSHNMYGFSRTASVNIENFNKGNWFWPQTPDFDEDGFPRFEAMVDGTFIVQHGERHFDPKVYLWPIPSEDVQIMDGVLTQNPGY
ncbi:MAG: RagB/SusD family nutrient uptake outer membrane protein [Bacteroidetes bacterium]|uniref:RagB/SusD family nutrient uptake outer membrane protein n=1 Tax=Candidatus Cryptobacteroides merdavium TaxID=2840769 RepID=A0A9D9EAC0_9BACT|nr:RagB/SusD family nutrient uptake outer membrane protein [Candidatus Cryptobacteroides merdavium]